MWRGGLSKGSTSNPVYIINTECAYSSFVPMGVVKSRNCIDIDNSLLLNSFMESVRSVWELLCNEGSSRSDNGDTVFVWWNVSICTCNTDICTINTDICYMTCNIRLIWIVHVTNFICHNGIIMKESITIANREVPLYVILFRDKTTV